MKLIIAGGRDFTDYDLLKRKCDFYIGSSKVECIISGMARGADRYGLTYAAYIEAPIERFPPDYEKYGRSAPLVRNAEMADRATHLIAFWDGKSSGTAHMITTAKKRGLTVRTVLYE